MSDDSYKYTEFLQKQLLSEGWRDYFRDQEIDPDALEKAIMLVRPTVAEVNEDVLQTARDLWLAPVVLSTPFENPATEIRYRPLLDEIIGAARELSLPDVRPIDLATSTDISCTPMARPTEGRHSLFIGEGTARFCNYWTKAISRVFFTLKALPEGQTQAEWDRAVLTAKPSGIALSAAFAIKYAFEGTLLRFPRVPNIPEETDWRAELLFGLLGFSVAHEYAHFIAHEADPASAGGQTDEESQQLELWCDAVALQICAHIGKGKGRSEARAAMGGLAFYRVMKLCSDVKGLYVATGSIAAVPTSPTSGSGSHPPLELRISALVEALIKRSAPDDEASTRQFLSGFLNMLEMMHRLTIALIEQAISVRRARPDRGRGSSDENGAATN